MSNPIPPVFTLKAEAVPYSSIVGSSVVLIAEDGRAIAQLPIMLPALAGRDVSGDARRKAAEAIAAEFVEKWNRP